MQLSEHPHPCKRQDQKGDWGVWAIEYDDGKGYFEVMLWFRFHASLPGFLENLAASFQQYCTNGDGEINPMWLDYLINVLNGYF